VAVGGLFRAVMDFGFPWSCAVCRASFEGPGPLCANCLEELRTLEQEPCCRVCAMSLPMHGSPCPYCMGKGPPNFERVVRLTSYHDPVRAMIHHLKYHRRWTIGEEFAHRLLEQERVKELLQQTDVLIPVPLHWRRQLTRGYNQADVIAQRLRTLCDIPVLRPVRRIRNTEMQTLQHAPARRAENLKGAFALKSGAKITGRHVVIVDDVWTSGATMQAMARALTPAKPASLSAIVIATADPRGLERAEKPSMDT
jgi:ComF family protein